jgi:hypothetical protein
MNETNRFLIVLAAAAWIVVTAVVIFVTWAAPDDAIERLADVVEFLDDNNTSAGKLVISLAALATAVLALLWIVVELAPEDEIKELRVEQAGATTIVPADALRMRLEEALLAIPGVTAARSRVWPRDKGVAVSMELTVTQAANVGDVTHTAVRTVVDTMHEDLGLPVSGTPDVRIAFGGSRSGEAPAVPAYRPLEAEAPVAATETVDERVTDARAPLTPPIPEAHADASPGPLVYDSTPGDEERSEQQR